MTDQIVGLTYQLLTGVATDSNERRVAVENMALEVGGRYQRLSLRKGIFFVENGQVQAHERLLCMATTTNIGDC
ncbi:MAG: hypothetical protein A2W72_18010 [Burkholderiales bacterium RIFCSPLOWO2_12_67_14]|nr:MAG: hypothetical protein A2W72_18010 [Burkholderiales bacterium RIFCSPLOWO2_12_67_14]